METNPRSASAASDRMAATASTGISAGMILDQGPNCVEGPDNNRPWRHRRHRSALPAVRSGNKSGVPRSARRIIPDASRASSRLKPRNWPPPRVDPVDDLPKPKPRQPSRQPPVPFRIQRIILPPCRDSANHPCRRRRCQHHLHHRRPKAFHPNTQMHPHLVHDPALQTPRERLAGS